MQCLMWKLWVEDLHNPALGMLEGSLLRRAGYIHAFRGCSSPSISLFITNHLQLDCQYCRFRNWPIFLTSRSSYLLLSGFINFQGNLCLRSTFSLRNILTMPSTSPSKEPEFKTIWRSSEKCRNCKFSIGATGLAVQADDKYTYCSKNCYWVRVSNIFIPYNLTPCFFQFVFKIYPILLTLNTLLNFGIFRKHQSYYMRKEGSSSRKKWTSW